jgi:hypothetical protein
MADNECVGIIGTAMYSSYAGYGSTLRFGGDLPRSAHDAPLGLDEHSRCANAIIAIDALDFVQSAKNTLAAAQWREENMQREVLKAYVGFSFEQRILGTKINYDSVATGNW